MARIFDIMGWFSLAILRAKLLIQEAWVLQVPWDRSLSGQLQQKWTDWLQEFSVLSQYPVKRFCSLPHDQIQSQSLHEFSDASSVSYGGVVYLRTVSLDTTVTICLLTAKSKLASIKKQTIPRLELCGAQVLSKLLLQSAKDLGIPMNSVYAWSDCCSTGLDEDFSRQTENLCFS